jgi:tetratricopeptide (TPR) repeat protein
MKKIRLAAFSVCTAMLLTLGTTMMAIPGFAQAAAPGATTAKIHGHAQDPVGQPVPAGSKVEIFTDPKTPLYTFPTDTNGDYKGDGIKPGTYVVALYGNVKDKTGKSSENIVDFQKDVKFAAGADVQVDFDMTREAYISKLPPDVQKQIAAARKANEGAQKENSKIKNVNKLLIQARDARKAGNFDQAITLDTQASQAKPDAGLIWYELGDSYLGAKKYPEAVTNYQKALTLLAADKNAKPDVIAAANNNLGEALAKSNKVPDAVAAYEAAAKADPTQAAKYYGNEAIVLFKTGQADGAAAAADKAIAADPNKPIPYYIKGWALVQHATVDPKTGKIKLPPGCADAYKKFLDMSPTGPLADDAKNILAQAGETVHTSFKKH